MKSAIEDVFYHSINHHVIAFGLNNDTEVKGLLKHLGNSIEVKPMFWKEGDPIDKYVPVEVDGYAVPFFLKYGTEVDVSEIPPGSESYPYVFMWDEYDPLVHFGKYCRITGNDGIVRTGKLVGYKTNHSAIQSRGNEGIHFFVQFDFRGGDILVINSSMVEEK